MKAFLEQVPEYSGSSFLVRDFNVPYFEAPLHFHPVYELTLINESFGKRFIGDHVDDFGVGDLVFMAPNLPHFYKCDDQYMSNQPGRRARAIIIQFTEDFLGKDFFSVPEMAQVKKLLDDSSRGIAFSGKTRKLASKKMEGIRDMEGIEKLNQLLLILNILSKCEDEDYELLSRQNMLGYNAKDNVRMKMVYEYVMSNFKKQINIKEVAEMINMSESAFCRYFKKKTRKTFISFLNELKVAYASELLVEGNLNVTQICYKSGFQNISNFNRQFKLITKVTPLKYKKQFKDQPLSTTEYLMI